MFYLYKSLDNGYLFTNPIEINPLPENLEYLGTQLEEISEGFYEVVDGELVKPELDYTNARQGRYPKLAEQLDSLWHDIDQGLFGAKAKTGVFYQDILAIKQQFPKTDK